MCDDYNKIKTKEMQIAAKLLRRAKIVTTRYTPRRIIEKRLVTTVEGPKIKINGIGVHEVIM